MNALVARPLTEALLEVARRLEDVARAYGAPSEASDPSPAAAEDAESVVTKLLTARAGYLSYDAEEGDDLVAGIIQGIEMAIGMMGGKVPTSRRRRAQEGFEASGTPSPRKTTPLLDDGPRELGAGEERIIAAIHVYGPLSRSGISVVTGYAASTRNTYLRRLLSARLVSEKDGKVHLTDGAPPLKPDQAPPASPEALLGWHLERLGEGESTVLAAIAAIPGMTRAELGDRTEYAASTCNTYVRRLGARELLCVEGDRLFPAPQLRSTP